MDPIFIGYDKDFYDAIPYVRTCTEPPEPRMSCWEIEPSFESIAEKLKFARDNPKVYDEYGLPDNAEIRGFVLEHPEFLFYAPEMQRLWELIMEAPIFRELLLDYEYFLQTLESLHFYEGIFDFLRLLHDELDKEKFNSVFTSDCDYVRAGLSFWAMNDAAKKQAIDLLKRKGIKNAIAEIAWGPSCSQPVHGLSRHDNDRIIGEYSFERIGSRRKALTIGEWFRIQWIHDWCIPGVEMYSIYNKQNLEIAFLRIDDGALTIIETASNTSLTEDGLLAAILNWMLSVGYSLDADALEDL